MTIDGTLVEFLIPVTILLSALFALGKADKEQHSTSYAQFTTVLAFGFVHGLGFSGGLRTLLSDDADVIIPMLGFNLGVEAAQLMVVFLILVLNFVLENLLNIKKGKWVLFSMGGAFGLALLLIFENKIW